MKTIFAMLGSLLLGIIGTWLSMRPAFGVPERDFYDQVVYYHAQVRAEGHYGASASTALACQKLNEIKLRMKNAAFAERARMLILAFREAHEVGPAKEFEALAENFFAIYSSQMQ